MNILVLNAGSSSLKYKLFRLDAASETMLSEGNAEHSGGETIVHAAEDVIQECLPLGIDAIGHRVVHGGSKFLNPVVVNPEVIAELRRLKPLDPLHNPGETAMIEAGVRLVPNVPCIAVFDTSFHKTLPDVASHYALPIELTDKYTLRRYGFHGSSYQFVSRLLLERMQRDVIGTRLIICHLGSGASVCALRDGRSIDTSMGLTPLEGLVMGTRCGDVDPGLVLYLLREQKISLEDLDTMLNKKSGLLGVSGVSADVRELEKAAGNPDAELALAIFAYRVRKYIGAYAAALGGVNAIAFTGGIGEHDPGVRQSAVQGLEFLGVRLDADLNATALGKDCDCISSEESPVQVWVVPTNEELQIAREARDLLISNG